MAQAFPSRLGGLREGVRTGLGIGQNIRQQRQLEAEQEQAAKDKQFSRDMEIYRAGKDVWDEETSNRFLQERLIPNSDGVLEGFDLTGKGKAAANFITKSWTDFQKHNDRDLLAQVLRQGMTQFPKAATAFEGELAEVEGQRLAQATELQRLQVEAPEAAEAGGAARGITELLSKTKQGREQLAKQLGVELPGEKTDRLQGKISAVNALNKSIVISFAPKYPDVFGELDSPDAGVNAAALFKGISPEDQELWKRSMVIAEELVLQGTPPNTAMQRAIEQATKEAPKAPEQPEGAPSASELPGRTIRDENTGQRFKSDGLRWVEVK